MALKSLTEGWRPFRHEVLLLRSFLYIATVDVALEMSRTSLRQSCCLWLVYLLLHFYSFLASRKETAETPQPVDFYSASIFLGTWRVGKMKGMQEGQMENEDCSQSSLNSTSPTRVTTVALLCFMNLFVIWSTQIPLNAALFLKIGVKLNPRGRWGAFLLNQGRELITVWQPAQ